MGYAAPHATHLAVPSRSAMSEEQVVHAITPAGHPIQYGGAVT